MTGMCPELHLPFPNPFTWLYNVSKNMNNATPPIESIPTNDHNLE